MSKNVIDIRKTGPQGYRALQEANSLEGVSNETLNFMEGLNQITQKDTESNPYKEFPTELKSSVGNFGESMWDPKNLNIEGVQRIGDIRANNQWGVAQLGAGIAKGGILAATTFADGVIGSLAGLVNMVADDTPAHKGQSEFSNYLNKFIDNPFSIAMQEINQKAEEWLPNYYTQYQQEHPWKTFLSANTIGDKFIKNLGFFVGAAYAGKINASAFSKVLGMKNVRNIFKGVVVDQLGNELKTGEDIYKAYRTGDAFMDGVKITEDLAKSARKIKRAEMGLKIFGGITSAMGEGRIEAITNTNQFIDYKMQLAEQDKQRKLYEAFVNSVSDEDYSNKVLAILDEHEKIKERIAAEGAVMENQIFLLNTALLSFNNTFEFGRFFAGGYSRGRSAGNLIKTAQGFEKNKNQIVGKYARALTVPFMEGNEEMSQALISTSTGLHAGAKINSFYGSRLDPEATEELLDWYNALSEGFHKTYGNVDTWEEGAIGFLTGMLGVPSFHMVKNESGKNKLKIKLESELWDGITEAQKMNNEQQELCNQLNSVIQSDRYKNLFQSVVRDRVIQKEKNVALKNGDAYSFKNAELKELVNWALMFSRADMGQEMLDDIDTFMNITPDDIATIKSTTVDKETGKSIFEGMSDDQIIESFKHEGEQIKSQVENFIQVSENLKTLFGDNLNDDLFDEMVYTLTQINDWESRFKDLFNKVKESSIQQVIDRNKRLVGKNADKKSDLDTNLNLENPEEILRTLKGKEFKEILNKNKEYLDRVKASPVEIEEYKQNLNDLERMFNDRALLIDKYNALSLRPELFTKETVALLEKTLKDIQEKALNKKVEDVKDFKTVEELKNYFKDDSEGNIIPVLDAIIEKGNDTTKSLAQKFKSLIEASKAIRDIIAAMPSNPANNGAKETVLNLLQEVTDVDDLVKNIKIFAEEAIKQEAKPLGDALNNILEKLQQNLASSKATTKSEKTKKKENKGSGWGMGDLLGETSKDKVDENKEEDKGKKPHKEENTNDDIDDNDDLYVYENLEEAINDIDDLSKDELEDIVRKSQKQLPEYASLSDKDFKALQDIAIHKLTSITLNEKGSKNIKEHKATEGIIDSPNSESTYVQILTNWVLTKYRIDELKDRHRLVENELDDEQLQFLNKLIGFGAFEIVESGALAELLKHYTKKNEVLGIHYIKPKDSQFLNQILLGIQMPEDNKEFKSILKKYNVNYQPVQGSDGKYYCIVGVLGSSTKGKDNRQIIIDAVEKESEGKEDDYFVSTLTNEIKKIYSGRMILQGSGVDDTQYQRPLPKNLRSNRASIAVYYNDAWHHGLPEGEIIVPLNKYNTNSREGSVWVVTKEADGLFYAKAANVCRFTDNEWNLEDNKNTPMYKKLSDLARIIVDPNKSVYDRAVAKYSLSEYLYIPEEVKILFNEGSISIHINDEIEMNDVVKAEDIETRITEFLDALQNSDLNLRFQIHAKTISDKEESGDYIDFLLESNVLTSDLFTDSEKNPYGVHNAGASFDIYAVNEKGEPIIDDADKVSLVGHTGNTGMNNTKKSKTIHINNKKISVLEDGSITIQDKPVTDKRVKEEVQYVQLVENGGLNPEPGTKSYYVFSRGEDKIIVEKIRGGYKVYYPEDSAWEKKMENIEKLAAELEAANNTKVLEKMNEEDRKNLEKDAEKLGYNVIVANDGEVTVVKKETPKKEIITEASKPKKKPKNNSNDAFLQVPVDEEEQFSTIQTLNAASVTPLNDEEDNESVSWKEQLNQSEDDRVKNTPFYNTPEGIKIIESRGLNVSDFIVACVSAKIPIASISNSFLLENAIKQIKECE